MTSKQDDLSKHLTARVAAITGNWWCVSGNHYTTGVPLLRKGRRICAPCNARIDALRKTLARR